MTQWRVSTKAELLTDIDRSWNSLNSILDQLTEKEMTTLQDAQGWAVKDHIIHLAAWERSAVFFLEGKPRHDGLGVDETLYRNGSTDDINAAIFAKHKDLTLSDAFAQWREVHARLVALLQPLSDADLQKPYRHYLPDEAGEDDGPPALDIVYGNTAHHYAEHETWIQGLVNEKTG